MVQSFSILQALNISGYKQGDAHITVKKVVMQVEQDTVKWETKQFAPGPEGTKKTHQSSTRGDTTLTRGKQPLHIGQMLPVKSKNCQLILEDGMKYTEEVATKSWTSASKLEDIARLECAYCKIFTYAAAMYLVRQNESGPSSLPQLNKSWQSMMSW